jgi:hypothetical protein
MPLIRWLGNKTLTAVQNLLLGARLSEYHSGFRAFSVKALTRVNFLSLSNDYHFDTEMLILFLHDKLTIHEVTIPTHYGNEKSYVNIWKYGWHVLETTFSYWLHKHNIRKSQNWKRIHDNHNLGR